MKFPVMRPACALVALLLASGSVMAHEGMHGPGSEYDDDGDGYLSVKEYTRHLQATKQDVSKAAARFAAVDTNKDGKLSSAEFARGEKSRPK